MRAKERHKLKLLDYLSNPDNPFPNREQMASEVLGLRKQTFYYHFSVDEIADMEAEALANRRKKYAPHIVEIDRALMKKAKEGDPAAVKLVYQRIEGWSEKHINENIGSVNVNWGADTGAVQNG